MINGDILDKGACNLVSKLQSNGYEAYLVGGCVRDMLLNKHPKDWDITTNALPEQVMKVFKGPEYKIIPTGLKHGTVTVVCPDEGQYEITTYRIDGDYSDGRHPDKVEFTRNLEEDLSRRDFTINAMAYDPVKSYLIDYFYGEEDIKSKIIRCVGNPSQRFTEDYLRILRALRFACQLGFEIDNATEMNMCMHKQGLVNVSAERIRDEFFKMILADPMKALQMLYIDDIMKLIIPEFQPAYTFNQEHPAHPYLLWEHTARAMTRPCVKSSIELLIALLLHDLGKLKTKIYDENRVAHYHGHPEVSADMAEPILDRLRVSTEFKTKVLTLIREHDVKIEGKNAIKRMLNKIGESNTRDLFLIQIADLSAHSKEYSTNRISKVYDNINELDEIKRAEECFKMSDLKINGHDLIGIGFKPGKKLGDTLQLLFDIVLESPELNNKEYLLKKAQEIK